MFRLRYFFYILFTDKLSFVFICSHFCYNKGMEWMCLGWVIYVERKTQTEGTCWSLVVRPKEGECLFIFCFIECTIGLYPACTLVVQFNFFFFWKAKNIEKTWLRVEFLLSAREDNNSFWIEFAQSKSKNKNFLLYLLVQNAYVLHNNLKWIIQ